MDDMVQNPEAQKLAQMLQQQQMQKFLQSMQVGQGVGAMSDLERQQMAMRPDAEAMMPMQANAPAQGGMPVINPQGDYGMSVVQPDYASNMPTGGVPTANMPTRRGLLQGAMSDLERRNIEQSMGQRGATMVNPDMMRRMPR
jgi:hypothetical protein